MQPHFLRPSRLPNGRTAIIATTKAAAEFKMEERREGQGLVIRSCPLPEPTPAYYFVCGGHAPLIYRLHVVVAV